jgi:hypothetical protein
VVRVYLDIILKLIEMILNSENLLLNNTGNLFLL